MEPSRGTFSKDLEIAHVFLVHDNLFTRVEVLLHEAPGAPFGDTRFHLEFEERSELISTPIISTTHTRVRSKPIDCGVTAGAK